MMAQTIACPNCLRPISADLYIVRSEGGFSKVSLGFQCNTCKTTYKNARKFWEVVKEVAAR